MVPQINGLLIKQELVGWCVNVHEQTHVQHTQRNTCTDIWCVHAYIMSTVAATTGPSLCVMTELDNKLTNKNTIMEKQLLMWSGGRGIPSSINTIIDIAVNP